MNAPDRLAELRVNPDWAKLPLFDRSKWKRVRFGDVVRVMKEQIDPSMGEVDRYVAGEHMDSESIHIRRWGTVGDGYLGPAFIRRFRKGQVLYGSRRTYLKKIAVAEWDGVTANTTLVLETVPDRMLQELLPWLMLSERFTRHSIAESKGSTNPYINWPDIAKFEFDLPPLEQQRRISGVFENIDSQFVRITTLEEELSRFKKTALERLVPDSSNAAGRVQYRRVKDLATMQNGRSFPSADYEKEGVRLIRPGNLGSDGRLRWSADVTACLPESYAEENAKWMIGPQEVLINLTAQSLEDGFIGRVCLTQSGDEGLLNQRIGRFFLKPEILPQFFLRCLQTKRFRSTVESRCEGSKIRHLYFRHFEDFEIPLLSIPKQNEIVSRIIELENAAQHSQDSARIAKKLRVALSELLVS